MSEHVIKILQYNLFLRPYFIECPRSGDYKDLRERIFIEKILTPNTYDIIFLQEVFDGPQISDYIFNHRKRNILNAAVAHGYHICGHGPNTRIWHCKLSDGGCVILSKYQPLELNNHIFSTSCNVDALAAKGVLHALLKISDDFVIDVFCTHLQSSYVYNSSRQTRHTQQTQLTELHDFVRRCINDRDTAIIGGDLNVDSLQRSFNTEYDDMLEIIKGTYFDRVRDFVMESCGENSTTTIPYKWDLRTGREIIDDTLLISSNVEYDRETEFMQERRLDYILALETRDISSVEHKMTRIEKFSMADFDEKNDIEYLSDHYGIVSEITIK